MDIYKVIDTDGQIRFYTSIPCGWSVSYITRLLEVIKEYLSDFPGRPIQLSIIIHTNTPGLIKINSTSYDLFKNQVMNTLIECFNELDDHYTSVQHRYGYDFLQNISYAILNII